MPADLEAIVLHKPGSWSDEQRESLRRHFLAITPELAAARQQIERLRKRLPAIPTTMVFQERPSDNPRATFRHHRGEFTSPKEQVSPGVPEIFGASSGALPRTRLALARWLVSKKNPLVGRVTVNRAWQTLFGAGLMPGGDFGTQSEPPTHPRLLDWLACEARDRDWSMKQLHRLIVNSATYRQSSRVSPELAGRDPQNRLLARGPRHRVEAEMIRDIMLAASGLLSDKMYGPSVRPPQPASVTALAYGGGKWQPSQGEDRYRRSLYTFSKRTAPFAAYAIFDAPSGENCVARRDRSNTPLQALTLLNDELYLEMSRALARAATARPDDSREEIATTMFRRVLTRSPDTTELAALLAFQDTQQKRFENKELRAAAVTHDPQGSASLAAWCLVARALMNLDEAITKQ